MQVSLGTTTLEAILGQRSDGLCDRHISLALASAELCPFQIVESRKHLDNEKKAVSQPAECFVISVPGPTCANIDAYHIPVVLSLRLKH